MNEFVRSVLLLLVLLNPFLVIVYLIDIVEKLNNKQFQRVLIRAGLISGIVFCCFAVLGDTLFSGVFQIQFASFQIFGGIIFLLIGVQFVFKGPTAIEVLRGESKHIAGAIAMPVLIGPGTISASVLIGKRNEREELIQRYFDIAGRITALFVGSVAIEMIMLGIQSWIKIYG